MLFTSVEFFIFFALVFFYQWYVHPLFSNEEQKEDTSLHVFLLIASYYFYMSWDYRFGALILISTLIDYFLAIEIGKTEVEKKRKFYLILSLVLNLGCILGFFKYYNFLAHSINSASEAVGYSAFAPILNIILPVGITFL
jgi:hypothetical protein